TCARTRTAAAAAPRTPAVPVSSSTSRSKPCSASARATAWSTGPAWTATDGSANRAFVRLAGVGHLRAIEGGPIRVDGAGEIAAAGHGVAVVLEVLGLRLEHEGVLEASRAREVREVV